MKKRIYSVLTLSAALALSFGLGANDAKADDGSGYNFSVEGERLYITKDGAKTILVGATSLTKDASDSTGATAFPKAVSAWDSYVVKEIGEDEETGVCVDLSKYSNKKDNFFLVKSDMDFDSDAILVEVPKSPNAAASAKWTGAGTFQMLDSKKKPCAGLSIEAADGSLVGIDENSYWLSDKIAFDEEEKDGAGTGTYQFADDAVWEKYSYMGATLTVMQVPDSSKSGEPIGSYEHTSGKAPYTKFVREKGGKAIENIQTATRAGVPVKLSIPKRAAAPKVTVDYAKGKIVVAKNTHYTFAKDKDANDYLVSIHGLTFNAEAINQADEGSDDVGQNVGYNAGIDGNAVSESNPAYFNNAKGLNFWVGSLNGKINNAADAGLNYVLDLDYKQNFYIDVVGVDKNYATTRVGRTVFKGITKTENPTVEEGYTYFIGSKEQKVDGPAKRLSWKTTYSKKGYYSLVFESADMENAYTINIKDKTGSKEVAKSLALKAASPKDTGANKDKVKALISQTYATQIGMREKFEKALKEGQITITIQRNGNKATTTWPGTIETFSLNDDAAGSTGFDLDAFKPGEDAEDDCFTFKKVTDGVDYTDKLYLGNASSKLEDIKDENKMEFPKAKPGSVIMVNTSDELKVSYHKNGDADDQFTEISTEAMKTDGNVMARKFKLPAKTVDVDYIIIKKRKWEVTLTGDVVKVLAKKTYIENGVQMETNWEISFNSDKIAEVESGTELYISKEDAEKIEVKRGTKAVTTRDDGTIGRSSYFTFIVKEGNMTLNITKKAASGGSSGSGSDSGSGSGE